MSLATERSVRMEDPVVLPEKGGVMLQEASHYDNFSDLECHCARKFQDNAPHKKTLCCIISRTTQENSSPLTRLWFCTV